MTPKTQAFDRRVRAIGASARAEAARDAAARMAGAPDSLCLVNLGQWRTDSASGWLFDFEITVGEIIGG